MRFKFKNRETKIKTIAIILLSFSLIGMFFVGYLIGLDIGKQKGAVYILTLTIEPMPDEFEPKPSKDKRDKI